MTDPDCCAHMIVQTTILCIEVWMFSFSEHCDKLQATLSNQIREGNEKENTLPSSEEEKNTEKGECLHCFLMDI